MNDENPFGGFDMAALLEQAQAMQEQLVATQADLAQRTVDSDVAGGAVTVTVSGSGELAGVKIKPGSFDADDPEDLEDLILAGYRDAKAKADALAAEALGPLAAAMGGGMPAGDLAGGQPGQPGSGFNLGF